MKDIGTLFTIDENNTDGQLFGLTTPDLVLIKPNYEAMIKGGQIKITEMGVQHIGTFNLKSINTVKFIIIFCITLTLYYNLNITKLDYITSSTSINIVIKKNYCF